MKYTLTLLLSFAALTTFSQIIDYSLLPGTWSCYKTSEATRDLTESYKNHYATFKTDSSYIEERRYYTGIISSFFVAREKIKRLLFCEIKPAKEKN